MRKMAPTLAWVAALAGVACSDPLDVTNRNNPDVERAYSSPATIQQIVATTYQQIHAGIHGVSDAINPQMLVMSFESYGTVNNFGMNARTPMPRSQISNERNNNVASGNHRDFSTLSRRSRESANVVAAIDRLIARGGTLGQPGNANAAAVDQRARAFALFSNGVALGNLAMVYDSAAIVTHQTPADAVPPLSGASAVMTAALAQLDSAQRIASAASAAGGFPLPAEWLSTSAAMSQADFVRLIRSYKARFRVGVSRTPAERQAVDWNAVIADATNGITSDLVHQVSPGAGWPLAFLGSQMFADESRGWHMMSPMIYGMADTSGAYSAWLGLPLGGRSPFLIRTPDRRFPSGDTRATQQANSPSSNAWNFQAFPYIRNRTVQDTPGDAWGVSWYDFYRFKALHLAGVVGPWIGMARAEIDMLAAEGYLRTNNIAAAIPLIDRYRTRAGLPSVAGMSSLTEPVPGGAACVPQVPAAPSFDRATCGTLFEAMKWEKRMETAFTGYGQWYFDARGWGDLPVGTALEWPVPYQEMDARQQQAYNLGGLGGRSAAAKGTYGF